MCLPAKPSTIPCQQVRFDLPSRRTHRSRGSNISRSWSPKMFKHRSVAPRALPGNTAVHQLLARYPRASPNIPPHSGVGGCAPSPRKLNEAPIRIASPNPKVPSTNTVCLMFGRMCRQMIRRPDAPAACAASTYRLFAAANAEPRTTRMKLGAWPNPAANVAWARPGPRRATTISASRIPGKAMSTSTSRMMTVSGRPR